MNHPRLIVHCIINHLTYNWPLVCESWRPCRLTEGFWTLELLSFDFSVSFVVTCCKGVPPTAPTAKRQITNSNHKHHINSHDTRIFSQLTYGNTRDPPPLPNLLPYLDLTTCWNCKSEKELAGEQKTGLTEAEYERCSLRVMGSCPCPIRTLRSNGMTATRTLLKKWICLYRDYSYVPTLSNVRELPWI